MKKYTEFIVYLYLKKSKVLYVQIFWTDKILSKENIILTLEKKIIN